jgi:hypothetical protein
VPAALPAALVDVHRRNNQKTDASWADFAAHRRALTDLLLREAAPGAGLLVLGAGNCNDLDLEALVAPAGPYAAIDLADVDEGALARAYGRQPEAIQDRLRRHAPVDLSGALRRLHAWTRVHPTPAQVQLLPTTAAAAVSEALPGSWERVVSAGLLTQLLHSARLALGVGPLLDRVAGALAAAHLRSLALCTAPGGTALLVTDVCSSETYPLVELWPTRAGTKLLGELSASGNTFTGADPTLLLSLLYEHPAVAPLVRAPRVVDPWLWTMSDEVTLLVYGIAFLRADPDADAPGI